MFGWEVSRQQGLQPTLKCTSPALTMHHLLSSSVLFDRVRPFVGLFQHDPCGVSWPYAPTHYHSSPVQLLYGD